MQHLEHCHISPSASFLLIPLLFFFVVDCSSFCFVGLFHSWMSDDTVNMWRYPVLSFAFWVEAAAWSMAWLSCIQNALWRNSYSLAIYHGDVSALSFILLQFFPHSASRFILQMRFLVKPPNLVKPLVIRHATCQIHVHAMRGPRDKVSKLGWVSSKCASCVLRISCTFSQFAKDNW